MKISHYRRRRRSGFVSILTTVVICSFLLTVMAMMYRTSIRALESQKKVQLQVGYEAKQQAFLRAVVTLAPKYAANTMLDESNGSATASFTGLFTEAANISKVAVSRSDADNTGMGFTTYRNGNTGEITSGFLITDFVGDGSGVTPSGVGAVAANDYPVPLIARDAAVVTNAGLAPVISSDATYNAASSSGDDRDFSLISYPDIRFGYKDPGDPFIARQNWWQIFVHPRAQDIQLAGLGNVDLDALQNEYILSIYEVPSQLAISASAFVNIGNIGGQAFDQSKVSIAGNVYAKKAQVTSGSFDSVATTDGATTTGATIAGGAADGLSREEYEAQNSSFFPISQASSYARSLFLPINPGFEFFDRFASSGTAISNGLSKESWNQYSRGCHQCKMQLDVVEVVDAAGGDNTPVVLRFAYDGFETFLCKSGYESGYSPSVEWVATDDDVFPIISETADNGSPGIAIYVDRFIDWVQTVDGGSMTTSEVAENHSLVVNIDYTASGISALDSSSDSPLVVILRGGEDLTDYTNGFSIVTNLTLNILENLNQIPTSVGGTKFPPLSIFAPNIQYGKADSAREVVLKGSLGSLSQDANSKEILALKSTDGTASAAQTTAELTPIEALDELPPVNVMNWLVVIQKRQ
ncbi:hypothetical protein [Rubritalea tangerina]|uniref:Type 4 fimbrial biogenesis protein PilX N-terminal domain-containing protein n=1 Tax=Rubritalea tangerina TaxID=430798 RepID=A0ABW4ZD12_9BACT